MCRRTKLTPELKAKLIEYLKAGNYVNTACAAVGITEETFYQWMKKTEFSEPIKKAQAEAIARNVIIIQNAAKDQWTAAAWFLERKDNANWGRKDKLSLDVSKLSDDELEQRIAALERGEAQETSEDFSNN
jgi:transposase